MENFRGVVDAAQVEPVSENYGELDVLAVVSGGLEELRVPGVKIRKIRSHP